MDQITGALALTGLALLGAAALAPAQVLPQCPPASPARISKPTFVVDQAWQRYRGLTPEHRCCARPCEPIVRFAAKVETNALALSDLARDPKVQGAAHDRAVAGFNAMSRERRLLTTDFLQCLIETTPKLVGGVQKCGVTSLDLRADWAMTPQFLISLGVGFLFGSEVLEDSMGGPGAPDAEPQTLLFTLGTDLKF